MQSKNDNIEFMIYDKVGEVDHVTEEFLQSLLFRYQIRLETSMRGSDSIFDCVRRLYYKCHKINPNRGGSYIDSPDWIKNQKWAINPVNKKNNKCFQYAVTVALNHENLEKIWKECQKLNLLSINIIGME